MKISRSCARKINLANYGGNAYEVIDFFAAYEQDEVKEKDVEAVSAKLFNLAQNDVEEAVFSGLGLAKYQLYIDNSLNRDNISNNTTSVEPASDLSCGSHTWYIKAIDNGNNATNSNTFDLSLVDCGGGGNSGSSAKPPVSTEQGNIYQNSGGEIRKIFKSGGLVRAVFPLYSIKKTVVAKIESRDKTKVTKDNPLPKNVQIIGDLVANFRALSKGKELERFEKAVPITFTYSDKQVKEAGVDEKTLKIYWWDPKGSLQGRTYGTGTWKPLKSKVNTLTNTAIAYTNHFTLFAVMGEIKEKPIAETTSEELKTKIATKITQLNTQLQQFLKKEVLEIPANYQFTTNLEYGQKSNDVRYLQVFLKAQGPEIYPEGTVSSVFSSLTKKAVIRFQERYAKDILKPLGLSKGTGFVNKTTRAKINEILGR